MRLKNIITLILILISYIFLCYVIYEKPEQNISQKASAIVLNQQNEYFAILEIPKIKLKQELFDKGDTRNNVDQNIMILKESTMPDQNNSILFLAAHSGIGEHTYFQQLDQLTNEDCIILYYQQYKYIYRVYNIYEENKTGLIHVHKVPNQHQIILTTCSPTKQNKQLIVNAVFVQKERETN